MDKKALRREIGEKKRGLTAAEIEARLQYSLSTQHRHRRRRESVLRSMTILDNRRD